MTEWFKLVEKNDPNYTQKYTDFYYAHPEIHCPPHNENIHCIQGTVKVKYDELAVMELGDPNLRTSGPKWLILKIDKNNVTIGLEALEKYVDRWVLVRVRWEQDKFKIDPPEFIFIYAPQRKIYEQAAKE